MVWSGFERAGEGGGSVPKAHRPRSLILNAVPIIMPLEVGTTMTRSKVRLGLMQMRMQEGQEDNLEKGVAMIKRTASGGTSLVPLSSSPPSLRAVRVGGQGRAGDPLHHVLPAWQSDPNRTHRETPKGTLSLSNLDRSDTNPIDLIQIGPIASFAARRS